MFRMILVQVTKWFLITLTTRNYIAISGHSGVCPAMVQGIVAKGVVGNLATV